MRSSMFFVAKHGMNIPQQLFLTSTRETKSTNAHEYAQLVERAIHAIAKIFKTEKCSV